MEDTLLETSDPLVDPAIQALEDPGVKAEPEDWDEVAFETVDDEDFNSSNNQMIAGDETAIPDSFGGNPIIVSSFSTSSDVPSNSIEEGVEEEDDYVIESVNNMSDEEDNPSHFTSHDLDHDYTQLEEAEEADPLEIGPRKSQISQKAMQIYHSSFPANKGIKTNFRSRDLMFQWNQCKIYCSLCSMLHTSVYRYYDHLKSRHNTTIKETPLDKGSVLPKHKCLICNNIQVTFDQTSIRSHLQKRHNISLSEYENQFASVLGDLFPDSEEGTVSVAAEPEPKELKYHWDQCEIHCSLCTMLFASVTKYYQHLYHKHQSSIKEHPMSSENILTKHTCIICKNVHNFDEGRVSAHLKKFHKMSLFDYEQQYPKELEALFSSDLPAKKRELKFNWDQCQITCSLCGREHKSLAKYYQHLENVHQTTVTKTPLGMDSLVPKHKCLVCLGRHITFDERSIKAHLRKLHDMSIGEYETQFSSELKRLFTDIIGDAGEPVKNIVKYTPKKLVYQWDQSVVNCALCSNKFTSISKYYQHLYHKHQTTIKQHPLGSDSHLPKHTCLLCKNVFSFDEARVANHMKKFHNITLSEYEQQFPHELEALFSKSKTVSKKHNFEWDQCKISCALCKQLFKSLAKYHQHLSKIHQTTFTKTPLDKNNIISEHKCLLCSRRQITFDEQNVNAHLLKMHSITIGEYENRFSNELKNLFSKGYVDEGESSSKSVVYMTSKDLKYEWDRCEVYCALCSMLFKSVTKYYQHLYHKHRTSIKQHPLSKDSILAKHTCLICKCVHNFDEGRVSAHLKKFHHISLSQYEQQFSAKLEALFSSLEHKR